jgi:hypothetical protein
MFEVIVVVCLAANGQECREFKLPDKQYVNATSCIKGSQADGAAWQLKNNKYTIIGTRCAEGSKVPEAPKS